MYQDEHNIFREAFRAFLKEEAVPYLDQWEKDGVVPRELWKKMGAAGYLCPWLPEEYGGSEADFLYSAIMAEEAAKIGCTGFGGGMHSDVVAPYIFDYGSVALKKKYLPRCATGESILALAMTEPNTGSDVASIKTRAVREGAEWVLNGSKTYITNGILSDLIVVAAKTDTKAPGVKGISLLLVESSFPGFKRGKKLDKMGLRAQDTAELFFDDCRIPVENLIGEEGKGFYYMMEKLQPERLAVAILAQAQAEAMLAMTIEYTKERKAFGQPICSFQHNAFKIVDMATEIKLGRTFLDSVIQSHLKGEKVVNEVSMAKAWITEMANRVAYDCLQLHGGAGFMEEYPICKFARDTRVNTIFAGTTEIMKVVIAKNMGLT